MPLRFNLPVTPRVTDADTCPVAGALLYFYESGTTTPVQVFADEDLTVPHAFPVVCDDSGTPPPVFFPAGSYKLEARSPEGATLPGYPVDPIYGDYTENTDSAFAALNFPDTATASLALIDPDTDTLWIDGVLHVRAATGDFQTADGTWWAREDVQHFPTLAAAQAAGLAVGERATVLNHALPGDGGGGEYHATATGLLPLEPVNAAMFGLNAASTGAQNSAALQSAVDYCLANGVGALHLPSGTFAFAQQISVMASSASFDLVGQGKRETRLVSSVTGGALGQDTDGYLFQIDGAVTSKWRGFELNYASGNGGIVLTCRGATSYQNILCDISFDGGDASDPQARESNDRRSIKILGNEAVASSTGFANYHNIIENCRFNRAYTHIETVAGNSGAGTAQPNQTVIGDHNLFERFIVAIEFNDTDECHVGASWFQQARGVVGLEDDHAYAVSADGSYLRFEHRSEMGADSRPYRLGPNANTVHINVVNNNARNGLIDPANSLTKVHELNFSEQQGVEALNNRFGGDVSFFGADGVANPGATAHRISVYRKFGSTDRAGIGFNDTTAAFEVKVENRDLDLRPADDTNNVIVAESQWDRSLMRLGNYRFWVDGTGKLRLKFGEPTSDTDGALV